jgi:hypothetical protein
MTPFQTFADEDLADPAAAHGDALVGQISHQPIQGPAGKGQAQLGGPGQDLVSFPGVGCVEVT